MVMTKYKLAASGYSFSNSTNQRVTVEAHSAKEAAKKAQTKHVAYPVFMERDNDGATFKIVRPGIVVSCFEGY